MFENLPVFVATTFLMLVVPGPDFVLVTRNALSGDRRHAVTTVVGVCTGLAFMTLLTASGLAAILAASPTMLLVLRIIGGAYLLSLGGILVRSVWKRPQPQAVDVDDGAGKRSPFVQGFLNNVLNPKALVFYLTFMPEFFTPGPPVFAQALVLGLVVVVCAAIWWTLYVTAVGRLSAAMRRRSVRNAIDVGAGVTLGGLGAVVLFGQV